MKLFRICYYLTMAGLLIAGLINGRREIFLLFFILSFVLLYALFLSLWTILSFSYTQELTEESTVKGSTTTLKIGIYNDKPYPFTLMRIRVQTAKYGEDAMLSFNLSPKSRISFEVPLYCAYRGVYNVGMTKVEINDIFGLLRITFDMRKLSYYNQRKLTVYPRLPDLPFLPAQVRDAKLTGSGTMRLSEDGEAFSELRTYRAGDPAKLIHWKVSASKRELLVKRFDIPAENSVIIAVDSAKNRFVDEEALIWADLACECAAAIARYSLWTGYSVYLTDSEQVSRDIECKGKRDFSKLYDRLATMPFGNGGDIVETVKAGIRGNAGLRAVYIITARSDSAFCAEIESISRGGYGVKCVMPGFDRDQVQSVAALMPGASCSPIAFGEDVSRLLEEPAS